MPTKSPFPFSGLLRKTFGNKLDAMLQQSMEEFDIRKMSFLLKLGANPNVLAKVGHMYPLVTRAARSGDAEMLQLLLEYGGDPRTSENKKQFQPIHMAALKGMDRCIAVLVKFGADPNARYTHDYDGTKIADEPGLSALYIATLNNKHKAARQLIDLGAKLTDVGAKGETIVIDQNGNPIFQTSI